MGRLARCLQPYRSFDPGTGLADGGGSKPGPNIGSKTIRAASSVLISDSPWCINWTLFASSMVNSICSGQVRVGAKSLFRYSKTSSTSRWPRNSAWSFTDGNPDFCIVKAVWPGCISLISTLGFEGRRSRYAVMQSSNRVTSGLSLSYRYHAGIRLRTSEYFQRKGLAVF